MVGPWSSALVVRRGAQKGRETRKASDQVGRQSSHDCKNPFAGCRWRVSYCLGSGFDGGGNVCQRLVQHFATQRVGDGITGDARRRGGHQKRWQALGGECVDQLVDVGGDECIQLEGGLFGGWVGHGICRTVNVQFGLVKSDSHFKNILHISYLVRIMNIMLNTSMTYEVSGVRLTSIAA